MGTRRLCLILIAIGIAVIGVVGIQIARIAVDPVSPLMRAAIPEFDPPEGPSQFSARHIADYERLYNQIGRRSASRWSADDRAWISSVIESKWALPDGDIEAYLVKVTTHGIIAEHIRLGSPVPDDIKEQFLVASIEGLSNGHPFIRISSISALRTAGWLMCDDIRPLIEERRNTDPDELVRDQARRFLLFADGLPENPDCPGKAAWGGD